LRESWVTPAMVGAPKSSRGPPILPRAAGPLSISLPILLGAEALFPLVSGDAYAYELEASTASDTATWNGSTTFTFSTETVVPEPRLAGVLSVMLLGLVAVRRKARC